MPMRKEAYPPDWKAIALAVKVAADWICQDCGMQCRRPGEPFDTHKRTMSVAHLNHTPMDCDPSNLKPMCSRCHLAYDLEHHKKNAAETRRRKQEARGQLALFEEATV